MENKHFSLKLDFEIQELDQPSYRLPPFGLNKNLFRFDEREAAFYSLRFNAEMMNGESWRDRMSAVAAAKMLKNLPGYCHLDYAFSEAAWASYRPYDQSPLMAWSEEPGMRRPVEAGLKAQGRL